MRSSTLPAARRHLAAAGALVAVLAGCSSADDAVTDDDRPAPVELELTVTSADVVTDAAPRAALDPAVRDDVVAVVTGFLEASAVAPVTTGAVGDDLDATVTAEVAERLHGADEAALLDVGAPQAAEVEIDGAEVALAAVGTAEEVQLVVAEVDLALRGLDAAGAEVVRIHRSGELTLTPDAGGWRIAGYDVEVERGAAGEGPS